VDAAVSKGDDEKRKKKPKRQLRLPSQASPPLKFEPLSADEGEQTRPREAPRMGGRGQERQLSASAVI